MRWPGPPGRCRPRRRRSRPGRRVSMERARKRITRGRKARAARWGVSSQTVTTYRRRASRILPNRKSPSGATTWVTEVSEYSQRGQEAVPRSARQPPGHDPQGAGSEDVEHAGDAVKSDGGRHAAQGADGCCQRRHQRRIGGFEGNAVIPKRPPGGVKPTPARARGQRRPEPVHGTHIRGGPEKHVAADVGVDPQEGQQIGRGAQRFDPSGRRDGGGETTISRFRRDCGSLHIRMEGLVQSLREGIRFDVRALQGPFDHAGTPGGAGQVIYLELQPEMVASIARQAGIETKAKDSPRTIHLDFSAPVREGHAAFRCCGSG